MPFFNIVAETNQNTVVTEYEPVRGRSGNYESEAELEKEMWSCNDSTFLFNGYLDIGEYPNMDL